MTNEQLAAYLEQLDINLLTLLENCQEKLNHDKILIHCTDWYGKETEDIEALRPLFNFIENLQQTILTLDPKRTINHDP